MLTAIISLKGHQHFVKEGDALVIDFLKGQPPLADVLAVYDDDKLLAVGTAANKYKIKLSVIEADKKGAKITARTYKAKARYRRAKGFRARQTIIKVGKITAAKNVKK